MTTYYLQGIPMIPFESPQVLDLSSIQSFDWLVELAMSSLVRTPFTIPQCIGSVLSGSQRTGRSLVLLLTQAVLGLRLKAMPTFIGPLKGSFVTPPALRALSYWHKLIGLQPSFATKYVSILQSKQ
ncbi:hypothetical protein G9A89_000479 [Geosiphon pyriformis]|nr:hypothetical protein G9A89_000479 [Geosiphon pyriformis]